jgi:hypothetical protein
MRALFFLVLAIIIGFGCVAAFTHIPGLVTFDKNQIVKSTAARDITQQFTGSKSKIEAAKALVSNVGVKAEKTSATEKKGKKDVKDLSAKEQIDEILDEEESVLLRKKMKALVESIWKMRSKMGF